jgi:hypothetical protein
MKRFALLLTILAAPALSQLPDLQITVPQLIPPFGMFFNLTVHGTPNTQYAMLYVIGNVFYDPNPQIGVLYYGQTDQNGQSTNLIPFQTPTPLDLTEAQLAAVFIPPAAPPIPTEIVALSLTAGPPPSPPPCGPAIGAMSWNSETCTIIARVKVCPGDLFEIKKNGVTIASGTGPASGEIVIGLGGQCLAHGDTLTGVVNGSVADPLLGPIHG